MIKEENLPEKWKIKPISDVVEFWDSKRVPLSKKQRSSIQGEYPYYGASGIVDYVNDYIFDDELVLIGEDGQNLISRNKPLAFKASGKIWVNNHAHVLKPTNINIDFLIYQLNLIDFTPYITGSAQPKLNQKKLAKIKVIVPPLEIQKKIVEILEKAEKLKEWRAEADRLTSEYLKSLFLAMFGDMAHKQSKLQVKSLKKNIDILTGYAFKSKDFIDYGIPLIKIGTVNKGYFDTKTFSFLPNNYLNTYKNYIISPGDLLISLTGTTGKKDYGNVCFAENHHDKYLLNQRVAKISFNESIFNKYYLYFAFKTPSVKLELIKSNRGIRQANINKEDILKQKIPIPTINLQNQFAQIAQQIETIKKYQNQSKKEIENLFNTLMQKAFKGELIC